jgi:hypothetical protein
MAAACSQYYKCHGATALWVTLVTRQASPKKAKIYQIFKLKFQNLRVTEGCWRIAKKMENARNNAALATIVDVSQEFGVTYRALRYYEKRGLLSPVRRGVARYYDEAQPFAIDRQGQASRLHPGGDRRATRWF